MTEQLETETENEPGLQDILDGLQDLLKKRRWWILLTSCVVALATMAISRILPDRYESEATLVRYQPVSTGYVFGPNPVVTNAEVVESITQEILSRSKLAGIIDQFNLYAKAKKQGTTPEAMVKLMRKDLRVDPLEPARPQAEVAAFRISFTAENPGTAHAVVSQLVQVFVDANMKARENRAERTTSFLKSQVEAARLKLSAQEQRLREFKARHSGELPEQQPANQVAAGELRGQLQSTLGNLARARQQRDALESSLNSALLRYRSERAALLSRVTTRHPEVQRKDEAIARLEAAKRNLRGESVGVDSPEVASFSDEPSLGEVLRQVASVGREIEHLSKEEARLKAEIGQYQGLASAAPIREQELSGLMRDYEMIKQDYTALANKQMQSELAGNLEERGEGVQFRLVDPPTLPTLPSGPPRLKISLGGLAGGLALGMLFAFLIHANDGSFTSENSVSRRLAVPFVVGVPLLLTPAEERWQGWKRRLEWLVGCALVLVVCAAELYSLRMI